VDRSSLATMGLVLVATAWFQSGAGSAPHGGRPARPEATQAAAVALVTATPQSDLRRIICEHFGSAAVSDTSGDRMRPCPIPAGAKIDFLIATVPDPEATHLAIYFDRALESLTGAAVDSHYAFERYWLPWSPEPEAGVSTFDDQEKQREQRRRRHEQPGVLVFDDKNSSRVLLIFLVGEMPTSGIRSAACEFTCDETQSQTTGPKLLKIAGPTFSGSLASLARELRPLLSRDHQMQVQIISGSVSSTETVQDFQDSMKEFTNRLTYGAVVENAGRAGQLFSGYLKSQWPLVPRRTAILTEDVTAFGTVLDPVHGPKDSPWITIRYPWEISHLRNTSPDDASVAAAPSGATRAPVTSVPLTLKDTRSGKDTVPVFAGQQESASQDAVLLSIAHTLQNKQINYAGILATDALDAIFLSKFLRSACPEIRIFVFDPDLLFIRAVETAPLLGIFSLTTYPLISANQDWTGTPPERQRIVFPSRRAQGMYNASRALLVRAGEPPPALLEYSRPLGRAGDRPPLWLTVVGRDGYWPVSLLDENDTRNATPLLLTAQAPANAFQVGAPSQSWLITSFITTLFSLLHCAYFVHLYQSTRSGNVQPEKRAHRASAGAGGGFQTASAAQSPGAATPIPKTWQRVLPALFTAYPITRPSPMESPLLLTATNSLALIAVWFLAPAFLFWRMASAPAYWATAYSLVLGATLCFLIAVAAGLTIRKQRGNLWFLGANWASLAVSAGVAFYLVFGRSYQAGVFLAYRSLYLSSGVSPVLPILLLALAFLSWAWCHLEREQLIALGKPLSLPLPKGAPDLAAEPYKRAGKVDTCLESITGDGRWVVAGAIVAIWLALFPWPTLQALDHVSYDLLYSALLAVFYGMLTMTWIQFVQTWRSFQPFLYCLERHPIRSAFSRLPKEISGLPLLYAQRKPHLFVSARARDCLRSLIVHLQVSPQDVSPQMELPALKFHMERFEGEITQSLEQLNEKEFVAGGRNPQARSNLQRSLKEAADMLVADLKAGAWQHGDSDSLRRETRRQRSDSDFDPVTILKEEFVALRYLIYIRYVFRHLKNLLTMIVIGFILSVISLNSYPFRGHRMIGLTSVVIFLILGTGIGLVFAQMERDPILSRITDTKANELGKNFYVRIVQFGALPFLTVLASQFPSLGRFVFSWLEPALEALR
jgi:hypothetical protein